MIIIMFPQCFASDAFTAKLQAQCVDAAAPLRLSPDLHSLSDHEVNFMPHIHRLSMFHTLLQLGGNSLLRDIQTFPEALFP